MPKAQHKQRGEVTILGPDKDGQTPCRTVDGEEFLASTIYLVPIDDATDRPNTGAVRGD
jgi:hypothetical protein